MSLEHLLLAWYPSVEPTHPESITLGQNVQDDNHSGTKLVRRDLGETEIEGDCVAIKEQLLHRNVRRFRGGLVFKAHRLCVSMNSRLKSNKEEEERERERERERDLLERELEGDSVVAADRVQQSLQIHRWLTDPNRQAE